MFQVQRNLKKGEKVNEQVELISYEETPVVETEVEEKTKEEAGE